MPGALCSIRQRASNRSRHKLHSAFLTPSTTFNMMSADELQLLTSKFAGLTTQITSKLFGAS
jgi:hypothetical protein